MRIMRTMVVSLLVLGMCSTVALAQEEMKSKKEMKGASEKGMENASDQAIFHRVSDWFATVGKSDEEKTKILAERKAKRTAEKAERKAKKMKEKAEKKAQEKMKDADQEMKKGKEKMKGFEKAGRKSRGR